MKQVKEMPQEGQFVAIWEYNSKLWSSTHEWEGGVLLAYSGESDAYTYPHEEFAPSEQQLIKLNATYFIIEQ